MYLLCEVWELRYKRTDGSFRIIPKLLYTILVSGARLTSYKAKVGPKWKTSICLQFGLGMNFISRAQCNTNLSMEHMVYQLKNITATIKYGPCGTSQIFLNQMIDFFFFVKNSEKLRLLFTKNCSLFHSTNILLHTTKTYIKNI